MAQACDTYSDRIESPSEYQSPDCTPSIHSYFDNINTTLEEYQPRKSQQIRQFRPNEPQNYRTQTLSNDYRDVPTSRSQDYLYSGGR
ncbi:hypothetical protein CFE70_010497 [Pyrenophora teres f. teres 0-1]